MNFLTQFEKGKIGKNIGIPTGNYKVDKMINGIQKKSIIGVAAGPKVGKSKFTDEHFLIGPYEWIISQENTKGISIQWIYFSYEMDRISKEFEIVSYYFNELYDIWDFEYQGKTYEICGNYLQHKMLDDNGELIKVSREHEQIVRELYEIKIKPLFGVYNEKGKQIEEGLIQFFEKRENPTGLRNYVMQYAGANGTWIKEAYKTTDTEGNIQRKKKIVGWEPKDTERRVIIITDHLRKLKPERGFNKKQTVDKWIEYQVELRNWCEFIFIDIIHLNRAITDTNRLKYMGDKIYATGDDIKDTGNLSEECNYLITLFNPADEKYGLKKTHFGVEFRKFKAYRSIHLVESRDTPCPIHIGCEFYGGVGHFKPIDFSKNM
jgi:hypothetical protein